MQLYDNSIDLKPQLYIYIYIYIVLRVTLFWETCNSTSLFHITVTSYNHQELQILNINGS